LLVKINSSFSVLSRLVNLTAKIIFFLAINEVGKSRKHDHAVGHHRSQNNILDVTVTQIVFKIKNQMKRLL
jgi:hypothetical protein